MSLSRSIIVGSCVQLGVIRKIENRKTGRADSERGNIAKTSVATRRGLTRKQIRELFFESCIDCKKMAAIPQGAFAAYKVHCNNERAISTFTMDGKDKAGKDNIFNSRSLLEGLELTPLKYNSKLMNSIWGLYNRYSVHNFKKNTDADEGARGGVATAIWGAILENQSSVANAAATVEAPQIMRTGNSF